MVVALVRGVLPAPNLTTPVVAKRIMSSLMVLLASQPPPNNAATAGAVAPGMPFATGGSMPAAAGGYPAHHTPSVVPVAIAHTLVDIVIRFKDDSKLVEQVFVVWDGLLEGGVWEVQAAVLAASQKLAAVAAPLAIKSAAAATQVEWMLQVTLFNVGNVLALM